MKTQNDIEARQIRGYAIISKGEQICKAGKDCYLIPSQSGNGKYKVCVGDVWSCTCPDFEKRHSNCKHIFAVKFWLRIRQKLRHEQTFEKKQTFMMKACVYCKSTHIVKDGSRISNGIKKQKYLCRSCNRQFVYDVVKRVKGNGKIITLVLDLWFKGISIRKICDHLDQFYDFSIGKSTVQRWVSKFTKILNEYTQDLEPEISGTIHLDEQVIKSRGNNVYCWNAIDRETRFLLASNVTAGREVKDAKEVVRQIKGSEPQKIITDGLMSYRPAIKKVFNEKMPTHIVYPSIRDRHTNNNIIERYHNSFRERDKIIRGFKSNKTAQNLINGHRLYYNYIRPHTTLGTTPSAKAGLWKLEGNRWLDLMEKANENEVPEKSFIVKVYDGNKVKEFPFNDKKRMMKWIEFNREFYPERRYEIVKQK